jgi:hypothetical protein
MPQRLRRQTPQAEGAIDCGERRFGVPGGREVDERVRRIEMTGIDRGLRRSRGGRAAPLL